MKKMMYNYKYIRAHNYVCLSLLLKWRPGEDFAFQSSPQRELHESL